MSEQRFDLVTRLHLSTILNDAAVLLPRDGVAPFQGGERAQGVEFCRGGCQFLFATLQIRLQRTVKAEPEVFPALFNPAELA